MSYIDREPIKIELLKNTPELLEFGATDSVLKTMEIQQLKKQQLIEDFIYKHLETHTLELMKLKIENELLERRLKESEG